MILLAGAHVVLADRIADPSTLVLDGDRIGDLVDGARTGGRSDQTIDLTGHLVVPGFIDVHVHGLEGFDTLVQPDAIVQMSRRLPRYGVTSFCPTSVACAPAELRAMLERVRDARTSRPAGGARVLPAHLESHFISPEFAGAQPVTCLRLPRGSREGETAFTGRDILDEIERGRADVGVVTIAPELDGALELIQHLVRGGQRVSIGHTGATYEQARAGIAAGASRATHLFNRMTALTHREPGVVGAVLESEEVAAELVCDGFHVHPAAMKAAIAAKDPSRVMAITDGTAGSGLPRGAAATLGGRTIHVGDLARLEDGTIAGSVLTMDQAFARLVTRLAVSPVDAAILTSTTPARELGLHRFGVIAAGATADLVVLDRNLNVKQTWIGGELAWGQERINS